MNKTVEQMLADLDVAISECLIIPNEWLPNEYHDDVRGGRTIARLEQECDVREGLSEHVKLKALKARNIERLRKQVTGHDIDCELDYSENETDELQQHKNEMAFVGGMISSGMIDASDLEEE
tara:strand:+ start:129 stop:494 length:366 start_codon:yes stop_codon:yes gene_type:complete